MTEKARSPVHLSDYRPPPFLVETVNLFFDLAPTETRVTAQSQFKKNSASASISSSLKLDGENLTLETIRIDGEIVTQDQMLLTEESLTIDSVPDDFLLEIVTVLNPSANKALEGLYLSNGRFCTQCEAEGFRRITYFPDRPDVLSRFHVEIKADRSQFPILLSNGNQVKSGPLEDGRHYSVWSDPFPKPCYLFALVAGDFARLNKKFQTQKNNPVDLNLFVEPGKESRAEYAIDSLVRAMEWDERVYGLEYDLDEYNVVAVSDFNMGAMENKSLNIFNDKFILADSQTATDSDYAWIESVIAHEYFHNWTGNRVTCRDWFQLSLKEGLTVFRDQQFSADMRSLAAKRIEDVQTLRATQFPEDASPLAHPVRPDSYVEINNFYTHTVYEKGAEVVRMLHTILGASAFRSGMDLYFKRHDGQAVTCEDFVKAMGDAAGLSLDHFMEWYKQAGTPTLKIESHYGSNDGTLTLTITQSNDTAGSEHPALMIPFCIGFIDSDVGELSAVFRNGGETPQKTQNLILNEARNSFVFEGLPINNRPPILSLNRGFSSPVNIEIERTAEDLGVLAKHDTDAFARWDAIQELAKRVLMNEIDTRPQSNAVQIYVSSIGDILQDKKSDPMETALFLALPGDPILAEEMDVIDPDKILAARTWLKRTLCRELRDPLLDLFETARITGPYRPDHHDAAIRALRNRVLDFLAHDRGEDGLELAFEHFETANNMTDRWAALCSLNNFDCRQRRQALDTFAGMTADPLVLDKWLALEASSPVAGTLNQVINLLQHPKYDRQNPNRIRALIGNFARANTVGFHDKGGGGYTFVADQILEIDQFNPQVAARIAGAFQKWARYNEERRVMMKQQLMRIESATELSPDVGEIVSKTLAHD